MQSWRLTEPMRFGCRTGRHEVSIPRDAPDAWTLPFGDRARRLAWPACGTERFLGRARSNTLRKEKCVVADGGMQILSARRRVIPLEEKEREPSSHGDMQRPDPVKLFGAASVFFLSEKNTRRASPSMNHPGADIDDFKRWKTILDVTITTGKTKPGRCRGRNLPHPGGAR